MSSGAHPPLPHSHFEPLPARPRAICCHRASGDPPDGGPGRSAGSPPIAANRSRRSAAAARTADPTLSVVEEPADIPEAGRRLSPRITVTWSGEQPRVSAAIWPSTVYVPVPISWLPVSTRTAPERSTPTLAEAGKAYWFIRAVAMPQPMYSWPSRRARGRGGRSFQPKTRAPVR